MSFIYDDKKLLKDLLVSGATSLVKEAQNAAKSTVPPTDFLTYHAAHALVTNLQRQYNTADAPAKGNPLGLEQGADPNNLTATPENLRTLGDFILWCAAKKFTWEGKRFAWSPDEAHPTQADDPDIWDFESMRSDRSREEITRRPIKVPAVANVKALTEYLVYLRDNEKSNATKLMLSKMIGELNGYLVTAQRPPVDAVSKPEQKAEFDPKDVVDGFMSDTLGEGDIFEGTRGFPHFDRATRKLLASDIADSGAFMAWLSNMKVVLPAVDKKPATTISATQADSDAPCVAVNVLYRRAQWLAQYGAAADKQKANYSKLAAKYLKIVQEYGSKLTGANGKPCAVVTGTTQPGAQPGQQPGGQPGQGGQVTPEMLDPVIRAMPLTLEAVDLNRILQFFEAYKALTRNAKSPQAAQVQSSATAVVQEIGLINSDYLKMSKVNFGLLVGPEGITTWLKDPPRQYVTFLDTLKKIVQITEATILLFYQTYAISRDATSEKANFNSQEMAVISNQATIAKDNMRKLDDLQDRSNEVIRFKR